MSFQDFVYWAFLAIISWGVVYGVNILTKLNDSVNKLNVTVGQMLIKHESHEKDIERLDSEIDHIRNHLMI